MDDLRIIAVDWSGDASAGAARKIWLAEVRDGEVTRLECGRDRIAMTRHLIQVVQEQPHTIVGLDFAFSFPRWFLTQLGVADAPTLWRLSEAAGESWLRACEPPFWGRPGRGRPLLEEPLRRTERSVGSTAGISPKSVFQIGGAGAVGTASVRGMPTLARLRDAGYSIWPFDEPRLPMAVEIYPRLLTGPVTKSDARARESYLNAVPGLSDELLETAIRGEDAFDALVSAVVMWRERDQLLKLRERWNPEDVTARLEGEIWTAPSGTLRVNQGIVSSSRRMQVEVAQRKAVRAAYDTLRRSVDELPAASREWRALNARLRDFWTTFRDLAASTSAGE
jgi:hypothetical protein